MGRFIVDIIILLGCFGFFADLSGLLPKLHRYALQKATPQVFISYTDYTKALWGGTSKGDNHP